MCVLYVSVGSKVKPRTFVQVVLSGFSVRLFYFVQAKMYLFIGCIRACVCVDVMVMSFA